MKDSKEKEVQEAQEALKTLRIYVEKHDHIGSIEKAFCRVEYIDWDSMPIEIQEEYQNLSKAADEKIRDIKWNRY